MAGVALSPIPSAGRELEDYVAGLFLSAGYFIEKGVHERDDTDVLELDTVATKYDAPGPSAVLVEAKGGRWGFPDIFKIVGWMHYLGINKGGFFVKDRTIDLAAVHQRVAPLGVSLVDLGDFRNPGACFRKAGFGEICDPRLPGLWRYSFWVERCLLDRLRAQKRAEPGSKGPTTALLYHDFINDHVFFIKDVGERLGLLYEAYRSHPKLSCALATEMGGGVFNATTTRTRERVFAEAMYAGKHPAVQASFYIEHRARLSILKTAIDLACHAGAAASRLGELPATFRDGLRVLRERPSFRRYALLWQVFLWGFGGFYLADRVDEEFACLSEQTGIPISEIGLGLEAFDVLFPLREGSWIVPIRNTAIRAVKMVPMPFRGVGAFQRLKRAQARTYREFGYSDHTSRELVQWHNSAVALLS